jgi:pyruvate,water dikinase
MATSLTPTDTFPADWSSIIEPGPPFTHDPMHFPFPLSPLMASALPAFSAGHLAGLRSLDIPEREFQIRVVNHYRFDRMLVEIPASEAEGAALATRTEQTIQRELARMIDRWFGEHRPRLVELDQRLRRLRPRGQDAATVLALLDEADAIHIEAWQIHFTIAPLMTLGMQLLREMHADLFGEDDGAMTLMAGSVSESMKAGFGLADLARRARDLDLAGTILSTPVDVLLPALETSDAGRLFLADLDAWLADYGLRQDLFDLATPTWREHPAVALASVRSYLETDHDPRAAHARVAQAAETAFDAAMAKLALYPAAVREQFEQVVQLARQGAFLQEEHNFYIDQRILSLLRLFYLEVGAHLADRGLLDSPDDVFMLRLDEIRARVAPPAPAGAQELVAVRREELAQAATMAPPPLIGDPAGAPPMPDTPMARSLAAFFGWGPPAASESGRVAGTPGSRGVVSGSARVVRTLDEARAVQPDEILVTVTTMPAWTPLFGIAAAVVTETGGPLSHCAVVAREYGIPAVVGARGATRAIQTGQRITVDGGAGVVTIES